MKKKLLALILAAALCLGLAAPALALEYGEEYRRYTTTAADQQYSDVSANHWAKASIETCSQRSWFNGYPDGTFRPKGLITREEAAKVFAVAMGLEIEDDPTVTYTDTEDNWARAYIEATKPLFPNAANLQGTASFRPTQTITREETIYALVIAWGYGSRAKNADLSVLNMFSDTNSISVGVKPYLAVAVSEGLVSGLPDGTIAAQKGLTRAEFATLLARALSHGYGDTKQEFQAPTITLDKYPAATAEAQISITGTVTPATSTLTLDNQRVKAGKDGSFTLELELEVGKNAFTLTAENAYGAKDSKAITVERTEELSIVIDPYETDTTAEEITITGTVICSARVTLTLDGTEIPTTSTGTFQVTLPLKVGVNTFTFSAKSTVQKSASTSIAVRRKAASSGSSNAPASPRPTPSQSATVPTNTEKIALVLDAECYEQGLTNDAPLLRAKLLFSDGTTEIALISKLNGADTRGHSSRFCQQLKDTAVDSSNAAFYTYQLTDDEYELTQIVADTSSATGGWGNTSFITDATIKCQADFTCGASSYLANGRTRFIVEENDEYTGTQSYCVYTSFQNLPELFIASGLAVGTQDTPGIAKYVFLSTKVSTQQSIEGVILSLDNQEHTITILVDDVTNGSGKQVTIYVSRYAKILDIIDQCTLPDISYLEPGDTIVARGNDSIDSIFMAKSVIRK